MSLPSGAGFDLSIWAAPLADVSDFTLVIDGANLSAGLSSDINTSDGKRARIARHDTKAEYAFDWISDDVQTDIGIIRVGVGSVLAASPDTARELEIYAPNTRNTSYGVSDTYGQYNAYDANYEHYHPLGDYLDRTVSQWNGTASGSPVSVTGVIGDGLNFNGTSSLALGTQTPDMADAFTISVWAKIPVDYATFGGLVNYSSAFGNGIQTRINSSGVAYIRYWDSGFRAITGTTDLADNLWHHIVYKFNTTDGARLYVDGSLEGTNTNILPIANLTSQNLDIGTYGGTNPINGSLCEVQGHSVDRDLQWLAYEKQQVEDNSTFWGTFVWNSPSEGGTPDPLVLSGIMLGSPTGAVSVSGSPDSLLLSGIVLGSPIGSVSISGIPEPLLLSALSLGSPTGSITVEGAPENLVLSGLALGSPTGSTGSTGIPNNLVLSGVLLGTPTGTVEVNGEPSDLVLSGLILGQPIATSGAVGNPDPLILSGLILGNPAGSVAIDGEPESLVLSGIVLGKPSIIQAEGLVKITISATSPEMILSGAAPSIQFIGSAPSVNIIGE